MQFVYLHFTPEICRWTNNRHPKINEREKEKEKEGTTIPLKKKNGYYIKLARKYTRRK